MKLQFLLIQIFNLLGMLTRHRGVYTQLSWPQVYWLRADRSRRRCSYFFIYHRVWSSMYKEYILVPVLNQAFRGGWEHQWRNLSTGFQNYTTSQQAPPQTTTASISVVQSESILQLQFDVWCNALMPGEGRKYIVWLRQVFPLSSHAGAFVILTKILFGVIHSLVLLQSQIVYASVGYSLGVRVPEVKCICYPA